MGGLGNETKQLFAVLYLEYVFCREPAVPVWIVLHHHVVRVRRDGPGLLRAWEVVPDVGQGHLAHAHARGRRHGELVVAAG